MKAGIIASGANGVAQLATTTTPIDQVARVRARADWASTRSRSSGMACGAAAGAWPGPAVTHSRSCSGVMCGSWAAEHRLHIQGQTPRQLELTACC